MEAYGFHLAPMAARAEEFEELYEHLQPERALCALFRNAITMTRRMIRARIDKTLDLGLRGPWTDLQETFAELLPVLPARSERVRRLERYIDRIKAILASVEQSFETAFDWPIDSDVAHASTSSDLSKKTTNMKHTSLEYDAHTLTTIEPNPVTSNHFESKYEAGIEPETQRADPVETLEGVDFDISWSTHTNSV